MAQGCGNCNYQGQVEATKEGVRIHCLCDGQCHSDVFKCDRWTPYLNNISSDARGKMAMDLRNREEAQRAHQEAKKQMLLRRWGLIRLD